MALRNQQGAPHLVSGALARRQHERQCVQMAPHQTRQKVEVRGTPRTFQHGARKVIGETCRILDPGPEHQPEGERTVERCSPQGRTHYICKLSCQIHGALWRALASFTRLPQTLQALECNRKHHARFGSGKTPQLHHPRFEIPDLQRERLRCSVPETTLEAVQRKGGARSQRPRSAALKRAGSITSFKRRPL